MTRKTIGIVDYGVGNHTSVLRAFQALGYRCRVTCEQEALANSDVLILPGVGAFPAAMSALHERGLTEFLRAQARQGKPMIGLCLGMQLMADESLEHETTAGLGLIPGTVRPIGHTGWHIGWNSLEVIQQDPLLMPSDGESVYFNHSLVFEAPVEYRVAMIRLQGHTHPVAVRRGHIYGLQFHPEKSQQVGKHMLQRLVEGLSHA